ncbi:MAG: hypothetical protein FWC23_08290 [Chitinispirillia bacterium]|nr:hypothetical protein [Chitinispirillia bacterium]MCL2269168.1 hypothetical protein [Chitinispirillia bacterium]
MVEKKYYSSKEIATIMNRSIWWVVKHRHKIVGASRCGRIWQFDKETVDVRLRAKKDIRVGF